MRSIDPELNLILPYGIVATGIRVIYRERSHRTRLKNQSFTERNGGHYVPCPPVSLFDP